MDLSIDHVDAVVKTWLLSPSKHFSAHLCIPDANLQDYSTNFLILKLL